MPSGPWAFIYADAGSRLGPPQRARAPAPIRPSPALLPTRSPRGPRLRSPTLQAHHLRCYDLHGLRAGAVLTTMNSENTAPTARPSSFASSLALADLVPSADGRVRGRRSMDMFCPVSVRPWIFCFHEARVLMSHHPRSASRSRRTRPHPPALAAACRDRTLLWSRWVLELAQAIGR